MAIFEGTLQEFHDFLGPRIRNKVQNMTKKPRLERDGKCEGWDGTCLEGDELKELHSAHIHGQERRTIIENVLSPYICGGIVKCDDIGAIEKEILDAHRPIKGHFKFLCPKCHPKYDSKKTASPSAKSTVESSPGSLILKEERGMSPSANPSGESTNCQGDFPKIHRIKRWSEHPEQYNSKIIRAYLKLERNGSVQLDALRRLCSDQNDGFYVPTFSTNYAQMKQNGGHANGKVFYDEDGVVYMCSRVREEVRRWFERNKTR